MDRGRLTGLDGLRGIAALAVLLHHVFVVPGSKGYLAVDFFFMLSGYVMARTYEARMALPEGGAVFMRERVRRLYPVIFFASLLCMPWTIWHAGENAWWIILLNLLLIPTPALGQIYMLNPPAWSILLELLANLAHALGLHRLSRAALTGLVVALLPLLAWFTAQGQTDSRSLYELLVVGPVRVLVPYGIGIVLYRLWRDVPPFKVPAPVTWGAMPVWLLAISLVPASPWWANFAFVVALCPLLIAGGLQHGKGSQALALIGELSFPLYAVHAAVLLPMKDYQLGWLPQIAGSLAAGLMFMLVMRRFSAWQRRRTSRPSVPLAL
jgi:peptidoglycan/LPS O-acetylase OafA/YrhL